MSSNNLGLELRMQPNQLESKDLPVLFKPCMVFAFKKVMSL
jgi:hypothetical protein